MNENKTSREEKVIYAKKIAETATMISDEKAKELVSDEELLPRLPHPISIGPGRSEEEIENIIMYIRKQVAAEKIIDKQ